MSGGPLSRLFGSFVAIGDQTKSSGAANEIVASKSDGRSKTISAVAAVASNVFMAALFLSCWIWPNWLNTNQFQYLSLMTLMEIIMVMLMFFLVPLILIDLDRKLQRFIMGFLFVFFGIFVVGMALGIGEYLVIFFFAYTIFNKVLSIRRLRQSTSMPWALGIDWIGSVVILFITMIIAFGLPMPELGLSEGAAYFDESAVTKYNMKVEFGAYEKEPQLAMAFGVVFYTLQAFAQHLKNKWADKRVEI
jgi:hypothetical protein